MLGASAEAEASPKMTKLNQPQPSYIMGSKARTGGTSSTSFHMEEWNRVHVKPILYQHNWLNLSFAVRPQILLENAQGKAAAKQPARGGLRGPSKGSHQQETCGALRMGVDLNLNVVSP